MVRLSGKEPPKKGGWGNFLKLSLLKPHSNETQSADVLVGRRNLVGLLFTVPNAAPNYHKCHVVVTLRLAAGERERCMQGIQRRRCCVVLGD